MTSDPGSVREFFAAKADAWDSRYPDDTPAYEAAVAEMGLCPGDSVLDVGCGTGRALPALREAVGPAGTVIGADLTPEMLRAAVRAGRDGTAQLVEADAARMPVRTASLDAVFAAGLLHHLEDAAAGLREIGRVTRPGARLALFHPIGRSVLAARHGHALQPDDVRAEPNLRPLLESNGWRLSRHVDTAERYLAIAVRASD